MLVGVVSGPRFAESWVTESGVMGFFDAKGALEYAFNKFGIGVEYEPSTDSIMQAGRTARITSGGVELGVVGELRAPLLESYDLDAYPAAMFEISLDALLSVVGDLRLTHEGASRFPESYRDLAVVVDDDVPAASIQRIIDRHALVVRSAPFDIYAGEGVQEGRKSVAFRVVFQSERGTLTSGADRPLPARHRAPAPPRAERRAKGLIRLCRVFEHAHL